MEKGTIIKLSEPVLCTDGSIAQAGEVGTVVGPGMYYGNDVQLLDGRIVFALIENQCEIDIG